MIRKVDWLNRRIDWNLDREISVNKALFLIGLFLLLVMILGSTAYMFVSSDTSYYDYRVDQIREVLVSNPGNKNALLELALTAYLKGDYKDGIALARKVYMSNPDDPEVLLYLGLMLSDRAEYKEAAKLLSKLSISYPGFETAKVQFYLGISMYNTGGYHKALKSFETAVKFDRGFPPAHYHLGKTLEELGRYKEALVAYQNAARLNPAYKEAAKAIRRLEKMPL